MNEWTCHSFHERLTFAIFPPWTQIGLLGDFAAKQWDADALRPPRTAEALNTSPHNGSTENLPWVRAGWPLNASMAFIISIATTLWEKHPRLCFPQSWTTGHLHRSPSQWTSEPGGARPVQHKTLALLHSLEDVPCPEHGESPEHAWCRCLFHMCLSFQHVHRPDTWASSPADASTLMFTLHLGQGASLFPNPVHLHPSAGFGSSTPSRMHISQLLTKREVTKLLTTVTSFQ